MIVEAEIEFVVRVSHVLISHALVNFNHGRAMRSAMVYLTSSTATTMTSKLIQKPDSPIELSSETNGLNLCVCMALCAHYEVKYNIPHLVGGPRIDFEREKPGGARLFCAFVYFAFWSLPLPEHRGPWKYRLTPFRT